MKVDRGYLGHALDKGGDGRGKLPGEEGGCHCRILEDVMKQAGAKRGAIHLEIGKEFGRRDAMAEIGVSRGPPLFPVRRRKKLKS